MATLSLTRFILNLLMAVSRLRPTRPPGQVLLGQRRNRFEIEWVSSSDARRNKAARGYPPEISRLERWDKRRSGDTSRRCRYPIPDLIPDDSRCRLLRPDHRFFSI